MHHLLAHSIHKRKKKKKIFIHQKTLRSTNAGHTDTLTHC